MKHLTWTYLLVLLALVGCKRYTPPELPPNSDPVFTVEGTLDQEDLSFVAGVDYIAESSEASDSLGVTYYQGNMTTCAGCPADFVFRWRANSLDQPGVIATTSNSRPPIRLLLGESLKGIYEVNLDAKPEGTVSSYMWTILGETYTTESVQVIVEENPEMTFVPVKLLIEYTNGCSATTEDTVFLPNHGCDCQIQSAMIDSLLYEYRAIRTNASDFSWDFESGNTASSRKVTYQYPAPPSDGVEEIYLQVEYGECSASARYNQVFDHSPTTCAANFGYTIETQFIIGPGDVEEDLGEVELEIVDADGVRYFSNLVKQDSATFFNVLSVEEFVDEYAPGNQTGMKVSAEVNVLVTNGELVRRFRSDKFVVPIGEFPIQ